MRTWDRSAIEGLITAGVPEGASLEFKSELHLDSKGQKSEVAKDLTGMGNAGGGSILFGVDEDTNEWPVATAITPLTEASLLSRVEDILQAGVHPPLVATFTRVEVPDGFVLAAEVSPSPLGPYMVELYGERRYHVRDGARTRRMTESEVSGAYAVAARARDQREEAWNAHGLPIAPPNGAVWLTVAGLPQEPLSDAFSLAVVEASDLTPPTEPSVYLNQWALADMSELLRSMTRWSDGFHAEAFSAGLGRLVRVHRDGAAGLTLQIHPEGDDGPVSLNRTSRIVNGALIYLGWLWDNLEVRRPIELRMKLRRCDVLPFEVDSNAPGRIVQPRGMSIDALEIEHMLGVGELQRASRRHLLCMRLADRVAQAGGYRQAQYPFRWGELYGRDGRPLNISVGEREVYADGAYAATIHEGGLVVAGNTGQPVGTFVDGVLADDAGDVLGVLELAPGPACPDDFVGTELRIDPAGSAARIRNGSRDPFPLATQMALATGRWSAKNAITQVRGF
jgi:hypothetical protein